MVRSLAVRDEEGVVYRPYRQLGSRICLSRFPLGSSIGISCWRNLLEMKFRFELTFETSFLEPLASEFMAELRRRTYGRLRSLLQS